MLEKISVSDKLSIHQRNLKTALKYIYTKIINIDYYYSFVLWIIVINNTWLLVIIEHQIIIFVKDRVTLKIQLCHQSNKLHFKIYQNRKQLF